MRALILRLEAPLIAFGGVLVDEEGVVSRFPGRSLLTGLFANALGWDQSEAEPHQALQARLRFAARIAREGQPLIDFHTVDLGRRPLAQDGWTTRGVPEKRDGGDAGTATHIRRRHYRADGTVVVALTLDPPDDSPTLDDLAAALAEPARPLFLGRKTCLPSVYLLAGWVEAESLCAALARPLDDEPPGDQPARWPVDDPAPVGRAVMVCDERDWRNQIHVGRRTMTEGRIRVEAAS